MTKKKQYGFAMAKPLPIGCIKNTPTFWLKFSLMIKTVDSDGDIGHLILIDIEFKWERCNRTNDVQWNISSNHWKTLF